MAAPLLSLPHGCLAGARCALENNQSHLLLLRCWHSSVTKLLGQDAFIQVVAGIKHQEKSLLRRGLLCYQTGSATIGTIFIPHDV
jgi:hypothetical protein